MFKTNIGSRIEVWSSRYINDIDVRDDKDKDAIILQIERGSNGDYIVEVIDLVPNKEGAKND